MKSLPKVKSVPFDKQGNMLERGPSLNMHDNIPFPAVMTFQEIKIGYSGKPKVVWKDQEGHRYSMFFNDLEQILPYGVEKGGSVEGLWMIRKAGSVYGLICVSNGYKI